MTKGTPSKGLKTRGKTHVLCRRCGNRSLHLAHGICASCGFGRMTQLRHYKWQVKRRGERIK